MIDIETAVEIDRPVEEVFAFVADQTNAPQWQADLHGVRRLTDGPIGVGTEHEFVRVSPAARCSSRSGGQDLSSSPFSAGSWPGTPAVTRRV